MSRTRSYKEDLLEALSDPMEAREYLNAALEDENPEVFLLALRDVVEANSQTQHYSTKRYGSMSDLRATLEKGNSDLDRVRSLLNQIGFKLAVEVNQ